MPLVLSVLLLLASGEWAQSVEDTRARNALHDAARAQERQAEAARQLERLQRDADKYRTERQQNDEQGSHSQCGLTFPSEPACKGR